MIDAVWLAVNILSLEHAGRGPEGQRNFYQGIFPARLPGLDPGYKSPVNARYSGKVDLGQPVDRPIVVNPGADFDRHPFTKRRRKGRHLFGPSHRAPLYELVKGVQPR